MVQFSRRQFMKVTGSTLAGSSLALMGFSPTSALAEVRQYKLSSATVTRQTCTYCSVGCGILMYSMGDGGHNVKLSLIHVEGDQSPNRLKFPEYRAPGSNEWQRLSWDDALTRISKLLKDDRDANFVEKTEDGMTVNRWLTTGMLAASASSNEAGYVTHKVARSWGLLALDNQARV